MNSKANPLNMQKIMLNDRYGLTQAVLEGRKTVTRRIISAKTIEHILEDFKQEYFEGTLDVLESDKEYIEQYFLIEYRGKCFRRGDIIAVAQSYKDAGIEQSMEITHTKWVKSIQKYRAPRTLKFTKNCAKDDFAWENKMYVKADLMPHQICITNVRIERLQDISDENCLLEGIVASNNLVHCNGFALRQSGIKPPAKHSPLSSTRFPAREPLTATPGCSFTNLNL